MWVVKLNVCLQNHQKEAVDVCVCVTEQKQCCSSPCSEHIFQIASVSLSLSLYIPCPRRPGAAGD